MENPQSSNKEIEVLMDKYLRKELSDTERADFEQFLTQNPHLQSELALQKDIIIGIHAAENRAIRKRLETIDNQKENGKIPVLSKTIIAVLGVMLIALLLRWLLK